MPRAKLRLYELSHTYRLGKDELPSVTTILKPEGQTFYTPGSAERGKDVHTICQFHDEGTLDESTIDPSYHGYYESYKKLLFVFRPKWDRIEWTSYHKTLRYAGTVDRIGEIGGYLHVVDLKTGAKIADIHGQQLAGYAMLIDPVMPWRIKRSCWHLDKKGNLGKVIDYESDLDFMEFRRKLDKFKEEHK